MTLNAIAPPFLGERVFLAQDQLSFAQASGDFNPMHVDAIAARRLLSGQAVVHGIHTLLCALQWWLAAHPTRPAGIACHFANPVNVGDVVVFAHCRDAEGRLVITASVDGLVCTEVVIDSARTEPTTVGGAQNAAAGPPVRHLAAASAALDEPPGQQVGQVMALAAAPNGLAGLFPDVARVLGDDRLSAIAGLSFYVGMVCPGLHSVFSSLRFRLANDAVPAELLRFKVDKYDPRFRLFTVSFTGLLAGELKAFRRPPPQTQPPSREVALRVGPVEFKGQRALVIGGSRGLGEVSAKILAAGGAQVHITFAAGQDDAMAVAADINGNARGPCQVHRLDLKANAIDSLAIDTATLDAVYYFATPRIYSKRTGLFDQAVFDVFADFYLRRFYQLCQDLNRIDRQRKLKIYLPSTVFITDRPKGMTEYAMVKAAAEIMADDLNRTLKNIVVIATRLPRLATDQTSSIFKLEVESNLDALLPVIRQVQG